MRKYFNKLTKVLGSSLLLGALVFAQPDIDPAPIADRVTTNLTAIASAGVGVLALSIGLATAFKFARRFLRG